MALAAAFLCALPTAVRVLAASGNPADGLLIAMAVMACLLTPPLLVRDRAKRGWRGVVGKAAPRELAVGVAVWVALSAIALALLAALLKAKTHHRGLGGGTFAVFGGAATLGCAVLAARLVAWARELIERGFSRRVVSWTTGGLLSAPVLLFGVAALGSVGESAASLRAVMIDLALTSAALGYAYVRPAVPPAVPRGVKQAAWPVLALIVVAGFARLEWSHAGDGIERSGGLTAAVVSGLEMWTDRDADGEGAHFGGHDCDEGDPTRSPRAVDVAGDGIDSNCDGIDAPAVGKDAKLALPAASASLAGSQATATAAASSQAMQLARVESSAASVAAPIDKPDIIVLTLDNVGAQHCSTYGYKHDTTPNLDKLAKRATLFKHSYAIGSETTRALIPIVSGKPASATFTSGKEWPRLDSEVDSVAERIKAAGYNTGAVTSFTWLRKDLGYDQGFDHFDETPFREQHPEHMATGALAAKAAKAAHDKLAAKDGPLFLWVHLFDAHRQYLDSKYVKKLGLGTGKRARYDGEVALVDEQVGTIVEHVMGGARASRTLWIVHGTHGEAFGEHDAVGHGGRIAFDEVLRVPLLVAPPGKQAKAARFDRRAVSTLDIAPTMLDYAKASRKDVKGVSLRPAVEGDAKFERKPVFAFARNRVVVIDWPLKLLVMTRKKGHDRPLLFDLSEDPKEANDLSGDRAADVRRLNALREKH
jgi:choline-sulfatase